MVKRKTIQKSYFQSKKNLTRKLTSVLTIFIVKKLQLAKKVLLSLFFL